MLWQRPENYSYTTWFKTKNKFTALIIKYHINLIHSKKGKVENSWGVELEKKSLSARNKTHEFMQN